MVKKYELYCFLFYCVYTIYVKEDVMPTAKKHRDRKSQAPISLHAARLIIATNRGPVEFEISKEKKLKSRRGAGGVVTALTGALSHMPATWVALAMTEGERLALKEAQDGLIVS